MAMDPITSTAAANQATLFIRVEIHVFCIDVLWLNDFPLQPESHITLSMDDR